MDGAEADIRAVERTLRSLIRSVLGDGWQEVLKSDERANARRSFTRDTSRRLRTGTSDLLDYTELSHVRKILERRWTDFEAALPPRDRFLVYMDRLEALRNPPAHSRDLLPFERQLVSGIAGELQQAVTLYRSEKGPDMQYYPLVESVTDSLGTEIRPNTDGRTHLATGITLAVGDEVQFRCRGWDTQNRKLTWQLSIANVLDGGPGDVAEGDEVTLLWQVSDGQVAEEVPVQIILRSEGPYFRHGQFDAYTLITYRVNPPA